MCSLLASRVFVLLQNLSSFESNALVPIDDPTKATQECVTELVTKFANGMIMMTSS